MTRSHEPLPRGPFDLYDDAQEVSILQGGDITHYDYHTVPVVTSSRKDVSASLLLVLFRAYHGPLTRIYIFRKPKVIRV
jgi:hypothetical protein